MRLAVLAEHKHSAKNLSDAKRKQGKTPCFTAFLANNVR